MNNFPYFTSSENFNQGLSIEGQTQELSIQSRRDDSKNSERQEQLLNQYDQEPEPGSPKRNKKAIQQPLQNHHKHDSFDLLNRDDAELRDEAQLVFVGPHGHKKIKSEEAEATFNIQSVKPIQMEEENERKESKQDLSMFVKMFNKMRLPKGDEIGLSNGEESVLYEYDPKQQEEERLFGDSLREMFSKKCKIASNSMPQEVGMHMIIEKGGDHLSFESNELNLEGYKVVRVLGKGLHGLVIKMRNKDNDNVVIKLFEKQDRKAFKNEITILHNVQKSKELSLMKNPFGDYQALWQKFRYQHFETETYYGIFIKEGLGSLLDFKEYLKKQSKEDQLSADELLTLTWTLLDTCYCLHRIDHCHRDIKPGNIILDSETFLPELIDYSLSSEMSKATGNPGTLGYRMEEFPLMNEYLEKDPKDQLISNDYFALGKTILEIAFPDSELSKTRPITEIKNLIKDLERRRDKRILAKILNICLFGKIRTKKNLLLCFQSSDLDEMERILNGVFKKSEISYEAFMKKRDSELSFREKYLDKFQAFMENKRTSQEDNTESEMQNITSEIVPMKFQDQNELKEGAEENIELQNEIYEKEKQIREIFKKDPEQTRFKCYEMIRQLETMNFPSLDMRLYSMLTSVLFLTDSLENSLNFAGQILSLSFTQDHWIFQNNLVFLQVKEEEEKEEEEEEKGKLTFEIYEENLSYFRDKYLDCFIYDLEKLLGSDRRLPYVGKVRYVESSPARDAPFQEREIILTFFQMDLFHPQSYFFMNYSFLLASKMDVKLTEEIRKRIQQFVFHINIDKRREIFDLIELSSEERVLFAVLSFCQILLDLSSFDGNIFFEFLGEIQEIISLKEKLKESLGDANKNEFWKNLLRFKIIYLITGFIIHYTLEHKELMPYHTIQWNTKSPLERSIFLSIETKKKEEKHWCPQKFLDSIIFWMMNPTEKGEYLIPINLGSQPWSKIYSLLFFGKSLEDLILQNAFISRKGCLLKINPKQKEISIVNLTMNFTQPKPDSKPELKIADLFTESNLTKLKNLEGLILKLQGWDDEIESLRMLNGIIEQLSVFRLNQLEIKMVKEITITDEGFRPILKLIQSQNQLESLILKFNLSFITSKSIEALGNTLINLQKLELLEISFRNCSKIKTETMEGFLRKINETPKLESVYLHFSACSEISDDIFKPAGLRYELELRVAIGEENHSENADHKDLEEKYSELDDTLVLIRSESGEILPWGMMSSLQKTITFIENNEISKLDQKMSAIRKFGNSF